MLQSTLLNNYRQLSFGDKIVFSGSFFLCKNPNDSRTFVAMFIYHIFFVTKCPSFRSTCKAICERMPGYIKLNCYTNGKIDAIRTVKLHNADNLKCTSVVLYFSQPRPVVDNMWLEKCNRMHVTIWSIYFIKWRYFSRERHRQREKEENK